MPRRTMVAGMFVLLLVGCGEPVASISGKATFKGAPVAVGAVSFHMRSKGIAQNGKLAADGAFAMEAPMPPGTYQVYYVPPIPPPPGSAKAGAPIAKSPVPGKYHGLVTSGLSFEVKAGKNDILIDFKD